MSEPVPPTPRVVYRLIHYKISAGERGDVENEALFVKGIGVFRSLDSARLAVDRLRELPGFRKWPNGFRVYPWNVDRLGWPDGFTEAEADRSYWNWPLEEIEPP